MFTLPRSFLVKVYLYIITMLGRVVTIFSIILTVADIISDIILAVDYCVTDNPWWCGLTWTFLGIPGLIGFLLLCICFVDADENKKKLWKVWKSIEICFESGPQLLLQLYIMAITDLDSTATSGNMKPKQNVLFLQCSN